MTSLIAQTGRDPLAVAAAEEVETIDELVAGGEATFQAAFEILALPLTVGAVEALRAEAAVAFGCPPSWPIVVPAWADLTSKERSERTRDMLCSVMDQEPERNREYMRAYRSVPVRDIGDVRKAVEQFFRRHGDKMADSEVLSYEDSYGSEVRWNGTQPSKQHVNTIVKRMAQGNRNAQVPSERLIKLFAGAYAGSSDQRVRKDAKDVVSAAYSYGSRGLQPNPAVFWRTITGNLNSFICNNMALDDCR